MAAEKLEDHETSGEQEVLISPVDRSRLQKYGFTTYQPMYDDIAFKLLAESDTAKTKAHVCAALQCSKTTLIRWTRENPTFKKAIDSGLEIGASKFRDRIAAQAFRPTSEVNNGLIKMLASNVYGIKEDPAVAVVVPTEGLKWEVEIVKPNLESEDK